MEGLVSQTAWIMDGNYRGTLEQRLTLTDTLIIWIIRHGYARGG
ncbi:hypothetical protein SF83666_a42610 (plasmid) [Sinorhizobium fredii CCBAU 83666]|nr:hypothetical protein SF83666_a42610 [Sinorhizobium fredii CCBAU 83666]